MMVFRKLIQLGPVCFLGLFGLSVHAAGQTSSVNYPAVSSLSAVTVVTGQSGGVKKSLTFSSGEVSIGAAAGQVNRTDLVDSLQYLAPVGRQQGLTTLCPFGAKDNNALPECVIVGIARHYSVQKDNMERWVSDITPQLIGQNQWDVTPKNNLHNIILRNASGIEPAFDQCFERYMKVKDAVSSCFQTSSKDELSFILFRLCYGEMKNLENGLDLNSNISTPITLCAVDRKTGQVTTLYLDEARNRVTVALSIPLALFELNIRSQEAEKQRNQKNYVPPKL